MRYVLAFALLLWAPAVAAQDITTEFYLGAAGGLTPSLGNHNFQHSPGDKTILSAGAFAGINMLSGPFLYGLEASVATDFGKTNFYEQYFPNSAPPIPRLTSSGICYGCPMPTESVTRTLINGGQASNESLRYAYSETLARPALTGRLGVRSGDWTLYGKAGLGVIFQSTTNVTDLTGTVNCSAQVLETRYQSVAGGGVSQEHWITECLNPQAGTVQSVSRTDWAPVAVYGLGFEYEMNQYFARGEVEATHVINGGAAVRTNAGIGIRF